MSKIKTALLKPFAQGTHSQAGWAIAETMIAIVIGLIVLAGVFGLVNNTLQGNKLQGAQQNLTAIRLGVQQIFSGQPDYVGLNNTVASNAGVFPSIMVKSGGIKHGWNGDVTLAVDPSTSTQFTITMSNLPKEAAMKMAIYGAGSWTQVDLNGTTIPQDGGGVVAASGAVVDGASNQVVFKSI